MIGKAVAVRTGRSGTPPRHAGAVTGDGVRAARRVPVPSARLVTGAPGQIVEVISRLLVEARAEYLGLDDPSCLVQSDVPGEVVVRRALTMRRLVDRRIRIRQITTPGGVQADDEHHRFLQWPHGGEARVVDRLPTTACIIDRRFALLPLDLAVLTRGMLVVTDPVVVNVLVAVHRSLWREGRDPAVTARSTVPPHLRPVLTALASGLPDARAAERVGVPPRTYSRRVAEVMRLLGAGSRFQAGVEAARRTWL